MRGKTTGGLWAMAVLLMAGAQTQGQMRITEWMYQGANGEFVEFTNIGVAPIDMTGWSFDDDSNTPGTVSLGVFGMVMPGESVILTDNASAAAFATAWSLVGVDIIAGNSAGLGRNDRINLYDQANALVDTLLYGDDINAPGSIRTQNRAGWPCAEAVGVNDVFDWNLASVGDAQGSVTSTGNDIGSPGRYTEFSCVPTGACCTNGACTEGTEADCLGGGIYQGDGSLCNAVVCPGAATGAMRITEWMYQGANGEFVEFTNLDLVPIDMNGWSFDDDSAAPGTIDLSAFGTVMPGESVILTDNASAAAFSTAWSLVGVDVIAGSTAGLGRNDQINLFDGSDVLVDRLTYGDDINAPGSIRTQNKAGWPCAAAVGINDVYQWNLASIGDAQGSYASTGADVGSPGSYTEFNCVPMGACCTNGACTDGTEADCLAGGGTYQGDGTDCGTVVCPAPTTGIIRITEYMYNDSPREFIEFTNLDVTPIDMTGWSFDDDSAIAGTVDLSAFGTVMPGQSVILTEDTVANFNTEWGLSGVTVIGGNTTNLGRNDQINLFDANDVLVDRLTYGDQAFPGTIRTVNISGYPCEDVVGANDIFGWFLSENGDAQGSYTSTGNAVGNPGTYVDVACPVCGNGTIDVGEDCETGDCCVNCRFASAQTVCRTAVDLCDVAENCTGSSADCPADAIAMAGATCHASAGECDPAELCDGVNVSCPPDVLDPAGAECRASAGGCDPSESCDGISPTCPADLLDPNGTPCRPATGDCDLGEVCDGATPACPPDVLASAGSTCRGAAGPCDVAELCDGADPDCPPDALADPGTSCRSSTGPCDPAEVCDGATVDCPPNQVITACISGDGCCPSACNANTDVDCLATCGNNVIEPGESCDDGNTNDGDGCSSTCQDEFTAIPTVSEWGLLVLALLLLTGAKLRFRPALAAQH